MNILHHGKTGLAGGKHYFGKCPACKCEVEALPDEIRFHPPAEGNVVKCPKCPEFIPVKTLAEMDAPSFGHFAQRIMGSHPLMAPRTPQTPKRKAPRAG